MRSGATQGIPNTNGRNMISIITDPARFPQSSHRSSATCCASRAIVVVGLITQDGRHSVGVVFRVTQSDDTIRATLYSGASGMAVNGVPYCS